MIKKMGIICSALLALILVASCDLKEADENTVKSEESLTTAEKLTAESIIGKWQSVEADYQGKIIISAGKKKKTIVYRVNDEKADILTLADDSNDVLRYLNADKSLAFNFSNFEGDKLLIAGGSTDPNNDGAMRPWILEKVK